MKKLEARDIVLVGLFVALITIGAFIKIPIFFVPFTLQYLFVIMSGLILGAKLGFLSVFIYMLLGLIGIPVFTNGGGITYILTPTFGYLIGFATAAFVIGTIANPRKKPALSIMIIAGLVGTVILLSSGVLYFIMLSAFVLNKSINLSSIIWNFALLFVPINIVFSIVGAMISKRINKIIIK